MVWLAALCDACNCNVLTGVVGVSLLLLVALRRWLVNDTWWKPTISREEADAAKNEYWEESVKDGTVAAAY